MNKIRGKLRYDDRNLVWAMTWRCGYDISEFCMRTLATREAEVLLKVKRKGILTQRWLDENPLRRKAAKNLEREGAIVEVGKIASADAFKYQIQEAFI